MTIFFPQIYISNYIKNVFYMFWLDIAYTLWYNVFTGLFPLWLLDQNYSHISTVRKRSNRNESILQFLMPCVFVFPGNCFLFKQGRWSLPLNGTCFICFIYLYIRIISVKQLRVYLLTIDFFLFYNFQSFVSVIFKLYEWVTEIEIHP